MVGSFLFSECMPRWLQRFLRKPELGVVLYNWLGRQKDKKQLLDNWQFDCLVSLCHPLNVDDQWVHSSASSHFSYKSNIWTVSPKHAPPAETYTKIPIYCIGTHTYTHTFQTFVYSHKQASHQPSPPSFSLYVLFFPFCFSGSKRDSYKWKCQQRSSYPILGTG